MENTIDVDVHGAVPISEVNAEKGGRRCHTRAVHQNLDVAKLGFCGFEGRFNLVPVRHISADGKTLRAEHLR